MPTWLLPLLLSAGKWVLGLIWTPKPVEDPQHAAGVAEAESKNEAAALDEVQRASQAGQDQRGRLAADPGRVRRDTPVEGAGRRYQPGATE